MPGNFNNNKIIISLGDVNLGGAELEEVKSLSILGVAVDSKLTFKTQLRKVVSNAARSLGVVCRAGN